MKITTILFTGTENTSLVLNRIIELLKTSTIVSYNAEDIVHGEELLHSFTEEELLVFAYPIYDLKPPQIIMKVINRLVENRFKVPVVLIATKGTLGGDANSFSAKALERKGYLTIAQYSFFCPSNGIATYEDPNNLRMSKVRFESKVKFKIKKASKVIERRYIKYQKKAFKIVTPIWSIFDLARDYSIKNFGERYYRGLRVNSACTNCLICIFRCPDRNLLMNNGRVRVLDRDNCSHCLRCITECPVKAIDFTSSPRRNTYSKELRDELFAKIDSK